jgi:hypothetical protein
MTTSDPSDEFADVAAALASVRAEVRAALPPEQEPTPAQVALRAALARVEATRSVSGHWPLSARNPAEQPVVLLNKVVRRYLRWYVGRIVEQQNATNDAYAHTIQLLATGLDEIATTEN